MRHMSTSILIYFFQLLAMSTSFAQVSQDMKLECNEIMLAVQYSTPEQIMATFADKFTHEYPIFYSARFRQIMLDAFESEFKITQSYEGSSKYDSVGMRKIFRDIQIDHSRYKLQLEKIGSEVWSALVRDFLSGSASDAIKMYSISKDQFEDAKYYVSTIREIPQLRSHALTLFENMAFYSIDTLMTMTRMKRLNQRMNPYAPLGARNERFRLTLLFPIYPPAYRYLGYSVGMHATHSYKVNSAIKKITKDQEIERLSAQVHEDISKITYEDLHGRLKQTPDPSELNVHGKRIRYDQVFQKDYQELLLKGVADHEQFTSSRFWKMNMPLLSTALESATTSRVSNAMILGRIKTFVEDYQGKLKDQMWVLATASETLQSMIRDVTAKIAPPVGVKNLSDEFLQSEFLKLKSRLDGLYSDLLTMNNYAGNHLVRCEEQLSIIRELEMNFVQTESNGLNRAQINNYLERLDITRK